MKASKFEPSDVCWYGPNGNLGFGVVVPTPPKQGKLREGLMFSGSEEVESGGVDGPDEGGLGEDSGDEAEGEGSLNSGMRVAWTEVIPPAPKGALLPPQKPVRAPTRGLVGKSFWVLGLARRELLRLMGAAD